MNNTIYSLAIALIVGVYLYALNSDWRMPFSVNNRIAFVLFIIIGMALCSVGIGHSYTKVGFSNPLVLVGMGFGLINLFISYVALTGGQFMFVNDYTTATIAIGWVMIIKVIVQITINLIYT